jgi:hypothetical protein
VNWKTPNWLESQDYPAPQGWPHAMVIWAWEFLRRNEEFRAFWMTKVEPFVNSDGQIARDRTGRFWPYHSEMQSKFGIVDPRDPRDPRPPPFLANGTGYFPAPAIVYGQVANRPAAKNAGAPLKVSSENLSLDWFETAFVIDLELPLDEQIEAIRELARLDQLELKKAGKLNPKRARTSDNYVRYLRILDAESAGATRPVVEGELFADIDNRYPENRRSKAFDNDRAEARRLRDTGYRSLAFRARRPMWEALSP